MVRRGSPRESQRVPPRASQLPSSQEHQRWQPKLEPHCVVSLAGQKAELQEQHQKEQQGERQEEQQSGRQAEQQKGRQAEQQAGCQAEQQAGRQAEKQSGWKVGRQEGGKSPDHRRQRVDAL